LSRESAKVAERVKQVTERISRSKQNMEQAKANFISFWVIVKESLSTTFASGSVFSHIFSLGIGLSISKKIIDYAWQVFIVRVNLLN
jgi:hypothetical protein